MENASSIEQKLPVSLQEQGLPLGGSIEQAIIENTTGAERTPGWLKQAVKKIADSWFDPDSFERQPGFYEKFRIRTFKKYMPTSGDLVSTLVWKRIGLIEDRLVKPNLDSLKKMETFTRVCETAHLAALAVFSAGIGREFAVGHITEAVLGIGLNTLINVYPIMLQRYNRVRLYKVINRMEGAQQAAPTLTEQNGQESLLSPEP